MKFTFVYCSVAVILIAGLSHSAETECSPSEDPEDPTFIADAEDCTKFYICSNGQLVPKKCPNGLHWNKDLNICDWPLSAKCQNN